MNCYVCTRSGVTTPAVALCRRCSVALCEAHRAEAEAYRIGGTRYGCPH